MVLDDIASQNMLLKLPYVLNELFNNVIIHTYTYFEFIKMFLLCRKLCNIIVKRTYYITCYVGLKQKVVYFLLLISDVLRVAYFLQCSTVIIGVV